MKKGSGLFHFYRKKLKSYAFILVICLHISYNDTNFLEGEKL